VLIDHSREDLTFLQIHLGGDRNFSYLLGDPATGEAAAFDPGFDAAGLQAIAREYNLDIQTILITHGHGDHVGEAGRLVELTGARLMAGAEDRVAGAENVADHAEIQLGGLTLYALHTPGHSPGHFCYLCEEYLVTGDLLFCGKVGGTGPYFPGSSAEAEYDSLLKLLQLPEETRVFPGHDYYGGPGSRTHSTIAQERDSNPFLTAGGLRAFCHLKDNWAAYKEEHGIK